MFKFSKLLEDVVRIIKIVRALKPMAHKRSRAVPHHKVALAEIGPKEINTNSLVHYTRAKHAHAVGRILKNGFVLPKQIMFVP